MSAASLFAAKLTRAPEDFIILKKKIVITSLLYKKSSMAGEFEVYFKIEVGSVRDCHEW